MRAIEMVYERIDDETRGSSANVVSSFLPCSPLGRARPYPRNRPHLGMLFRLAHSNQVLGALLRHNRVRDIVINKLV